MQLKRILVGIRASLSLRKVMVELYPSRKSRAADDAAHVKRACVANQNELQTRVYRDYSGDHHPTLLLIANRLLITSPHGFDKSAPVAALPDQPLKEPV